MKKQNKNIFLTGFPGFIGEKLVKKLSKDKKNFLFLLVERRFKKRARVCLSKIDDGAKERIQIIVGDITKKNLGIKKNRLNELYKKIDVIFHLAGIYDLKISKEIALKVNLEGTKNILKLAENVENMEKFNYFSTCYVSGKRRGIVLENELEKNQKFKNNYEISKYLAEIEVRKHMGNLPITIFRPAIVVGGSKNGEICKYDGPYHIINFLLRFSKIDKLGVARLCNVFGIKGVRLNLIPVDYLIEVVNFISNHKSSRGKTYQICDHNPLKTDKFLIEILRLIYPRYRFDKAIIWVPRTIFSMISRFILSIKPIRGIIKVPREIIDYLVIDVKYSNKETSQILSKSKIKLPPIKNQLGKMVKYVEDNPSVEVV